MKYEGLAPNETMQLHELLTFKNLCLTKSITMSPLVTDEELKTILKNDIEASRQQIGELKSFLEEVMNEFSSLNH